MGQLSEFQTACERKLQEILLSFGRRLENREIKGEKESYIEAKIENTGIYIWIYEDEAQFRGDGLERRYEAPDYSASGDLIADFVGELAAVLERRRSQNAR
jgi:hypothetical protein